MDIYRKSTSSLLRELGERLRQTRLDANLTQRALADATGVSQKTVANAEDGQNISVETLLLLLRGLNRLEDISALLTDNGPSPVQLASTQGRQRQRASGERARDDDDTDTRDDDWQW